MKRITLAHSLCLRIEQAHQRAKQRKGEPVLPRRVHPARNAACPCGSGKKYKHCHGVG